MDKICVAGTIVTAAVATTAIEPTVSPVIDFIWVTAGKVGYSTAVITFLVAADQPPSSPRHDATRAARQYESAASPESSASSSKPSSAIVKLISDSIANTVSADIYGGAPI